MFVFHFFVFVNIAISSFLPFCILHIFLFNNLYVFEHSVGLLNFPLLMIVVNCNPRRLLGLRQSLELLLLAHCQTGIVCHAVFSFRAATSEIANDAAVVEVCAWGSRTRRLLHPFLKTERIERSIVVGFVR